MSYCRFENTFNDLQDCLENINDYKMSYMELRFRNRLVETCKEIIEQAEEIKREDLKED